MCSYCVRFWWLLLTQACQNITELFIWKSSAKSLEKLSWVRNIVIDLFYFPALKFYQKTSLLWFQAKSAAVSMELKQHFFTHLTNKANTWIMQKLQNNVHPIQNCISHFSCSFCIFPYIWIIKIKAIIFCLENRQKCWFKFTKRKTTRGQRVF